MEEKEKEEEEEEVETTVEGDEEEEENERRARKLFRECSRTSGFFLTLRVIFCGRIKMFLRYLHG